MERKRVEILLVIAVFVAYLGLQAFVLPKLGVPT